MSSNTEGSFRIDHDNAVWLETLAHRYFEGDVEDAVNTILRTARRLNLLPADPWAEGINPWEPPGPPRSADPGE